MAHWKGPVGSSRHIRVSCEAKAVLQVDYLEGARQISFRVLGVVETEHSDQSEPGISSYSYSFLGCCGFCDIVSYLIKSFSQTCC